METTAVPKPRQHTLSVMISPDFAAWIDRLAARDRISRSDVVDRALTAYARSVEFPEPAPRRTAGSRICSQGGR